MKISQLILYLLLKDQRLDLEMNLMNMNENLNLTVTDM